MTDYLFEIAAHVPARCIYLHEIAYILAPAPHCEIPEQHLVTLLVLHHADPHMSELLHYQIVPSIH